MITLPSLETAERIADSNSLQWADKLLCFPAPMGAVSAAGIAKGDVAYLTNDVYQSHIIAAGNSITITITLNKADRPGALIIGNTNADWISGGLYNGGSPVSDISNLKWITHSGYYIYTDNGKRVLLGKKEKTEEEPDPNKLRLYRRLAPDTNNLDITDQRVLLLRIADTFDKAEITLSRNDTEQIILHKLWLSEAVEFLADPYPQYEYIHNGGGQWTDQGLVYGTNITPSARVLSMKRDAVDDIDRRKFEAYIETVKNNKPHFIVPCNNDDRYVPPIFGSIIEAKIDNKKYAPSWFWKGVSIKWKQCN